MHGNENQKCLLAMETNPIISVKVKNYKVKSKKNKLKMKYPLWLVAIYREHSLIFKKVKIKRVKKGESENSSAIETTLPTLM